jgi:hypothetical protein
MKLMTLAAAAALTLCTTAAFAQMTGQYKVDGQNPDGSKYSGTAAIEKTGDTYRVTWTISGERFIGTGIGSPEAIAIGYRSGSQTGVGLLGKDGENYLMVWSYMGSRQLGGEKWTRQ